MKRDNELSVHDTCSYVYNTCLHKREIPPGHGVPSFVTYLGYVAFAQGTIIFVRGVTTLTH